jgi:PST family polysaccharide transporter
VVAAVVTPCLLGLVVVAPDFVDVVLGRSWRSATPVIQLLAGVGLLQTLQFLNPIVLQALDRTGLLVRWSIFSLVASLTAFSLGLLWGIRGVAAAYLIVSLATEPVYAWLTARAADLKLLRLVTTLRGVAVCAIGMAVTLLAVRWLLLRSGAGAGIRLAMLVPVGGAVYLALCRWWAQDLVTELKSVRGRAAQRAESYVVPNTPTA